MGRAQMTAEADGCRMEQLLCLEDMPPVETTLAELLVPSHQRGGNRMSSLQNLLLFLGALPGSPGIRFRSLAPALIGMATAWPLITCIRARLHHGAHEDCNLRTNHDTGTFAHIQTLSRYTT
jgi:hypothetical protein